MNKQTNIIIALIVLIGIFSILVYHQFNNREKYTDAPTNTAATDPTNTAATDPTTTAATDPTTTAATDPTITVVANPTTTASSITYADLPNDNNEGENDNIDCTNYMESINNLKNDYNDLQKRILREAHPYEFAKIHRAIGYAAREAPDHIVNEYKQIVATYVKTMRMCPQGKCSSDMKQLIRDLRKRLTLSKLKILSNSSDLTKRLVKRHVDSIIYNADKPLLEELNKIENKYTQILNICGATM